MNYFNAHLLKRHKPQLDVEELHRMLGIPVGETIAIRRPELREELIREESKELRNAIKDRDLVAAIDGMCDLMVVTYGTAVEWGINLTPFWDEVHRTNMNKRGGPIRADGKRLKPKGWKPPDIAGVLVDPRFGMVLEEQ